MLFEQNKILKLVSSSTLHVYCVSTPCMIFFLCVLPISDGHSNTFLKQSVILMKLYQKLEHQQFRRRLETQ